MKERGFLAEATLCLSASNALLIATPGIPSSCNGGFWTYDASAFAEKHGICTAVS